MTVVDTETERLLRDRLAQLRPGDPILGEEGGGPADPAANAAGTVTWVLDPIDGTVNFVYGIPAYAVSVAAQVDGVSVAGAVADVVGGRVYSAGAGLGAHVIDAATARVALRCTAVDELSMALLGTGFGYSPRRRAAQAALLSRLLPRRPRRAPDRFCRTGFVHGCRGPAGRLLRARPARLGLGGGCVDRRRGRRPGACCRRRTSDAAVDGRRRAGHRRRTAGLRWIGSAAWRPIPG